MTAKKREKKLRQFSLVLSLTEVNDFINHLLTQRATAMIVEVVQIAPDQVSCHRVVDPAEALEPAENV